VGSVDFVGERETGGRETGEMEEWIKVKGEG